MRRVYITEQDIGLQHTLLLQRHQTMDSKATENAPGQSDYFLSYNPTDPSLRDSPALVHLQRCILQVSAQAIEAGNSLSQVQSRLAQHQTQFDAFLRTLDGLFRPLPPTNRIQRRVLNGPPQHNRSPEVPTLLLDPALTTAVHNDSAGAAPLDVARTPTPRSSTNLFQRPRTFAPAHYNRSPEVPALLLDPTVPQKSASVTAVWNGYDTDASLRASDNFPDTPQFRPDNPRYLENRRRHLEAVAVQRALIDEDRSAANSNMVGDWLENVSEQPINTAQYSAQPRNPNKRRRTSVDEVQDNAVDPPGVGDPTADQDRV